MFLRVRVVGMLIDKNTKKVMLGNIEIKRIMSERGGVLWERMYRWNKYNLKPVYKTVKRKNERWVKITQLPNESTYRYILNKTSDELRDMISDSSVKYKYKEFRSRVDSNSIVIEGKEVVEVTDNVIDHYIQGDFIGEVQSTNKSQYPSNGKSGNYWYVLKN